MAFSAKQSVFLNEYLKCRNATEAARRAGYAHPNKQGPRLLVNVGISQEIEQRTKERAMEADEVLALQADVARGTMEDFVSFTYDPYPAFTLDLAKARRRGVLHLIKKLKYNSEGLPEIELYDAADARKTLMKHLGLLAETVDHDGTIDLNVRYVNDWRDTDSQDE